MCAARTACGGALVNRNRNRNKIQVDPSRQTRALARAACGVFFLLEDLLVEDAADRQWQCAPSGKDTKSDKSFFLF